MLEKISDGTACRALRKATGASMKTLAKRAGVSEGTIHRYEIDCSVRYITQRSISRALLEIISEYMEATNSTLDEVCKKADKVVDKILGRSE